MSDGTVENGTVARLLATLPQVGRLDWIGLRGARRGEVASVERAVAVAGLGLQGDHRSEGREPNPEAKRLVTLLQAEHLPVIAALSGREQVPAEWTRRNLLVSGINLHALKDRRFAIGEAVLEGTGICHPCSRMEEALGPGGYNAMRGHSGITARIVEGGELRVGDEVRLLSAEQL